MSIDSLAQLADSSDPVGEILNRRRRLEEIKAAEQVVAMCDRRVLAATTAAESARATLKAAIAEREAADSELRRIIRGEPRQRPLFEDEETETDREETAADENLAAGGYHLTVRDEQRRKDRQRRSPPGRVAPGFGRPPRSRGAHRP